MGHALMILRIANRGTLNVLMTLVEKDFLAVNWMALKTQVPPSERSDPLSLVSTPSVKVIH